MASVGQQENDLGKVYAVCVYKVNESKAEKDHQIVEILMCSSPSSPRAAGFVSVGSGLWSRHSTGPGVLNSVGAPLSGQGLALLFSGPCCKPWLWGTRQGVPLS